MSGPFVSPRVEVPFEFEGVTFRLKPLTAEQKLPMLLAASAGQDSVTYGPEAFRVALRHGLVGWDPMNGMPSWNSADHGANTALLSDAAYIAIGQRIIEMSMVSEDEKKS